MKQKQKAILKWSMLLTLVAGLTSTNGSFFASGQASAATAAPKHDVIVHGARKAAYGWYSHNWTGYAETAAPNTYTSISADWIVPSVQALKNKHTYSATWIGIDGYSDNNLIQVGTEQDDNHGQTSYYAWWEILPNPETVMDSTSYPVKPGDAIAANITETDPTNHTWTITISDVTANWTYTTTQTYNGPQASAEWIEEAPYVNGKISQLSNYGSTIFTNATLNGGSPHFTFKRAGAMVGGNRLVSTPSAPLWSTSGFALSYGAHVTNKTIHLMVRRTHRINWTVPTSLS